MAQSHPEAAAIAVRSEEVFCSPEKAQALLAFNTFDGQRPYRPAYAQFLASEMKQGRFKGRQRIEFAVVNGKLVLVDGQHRLSAVIISGVSQLVELVYFEDCTEEDLRRLQATTDAGIVRPLTSRVKALGLGKRLGRTDTQVLWAQNAMRILLAGFNGRLTGRISALDVEAGILEYADGLQLFVGAIAGCPKEMASSIRRAATVAVALITCQDAPHRLGLERTVEFWQGVALGNCDKPGDPRNTLRVDLISMSLHIVDQARLAKHFSVEESVWRIVRCWDAWVKEESILRIQRPAVLPPVRIAYTRFDGSQQPSPTQAESNGQVRSKEKGGRN